ncbi:hypothetical protein CKA38_12630 [Ereboglobus luteus]|uniref:Transposase n=2 Tax=Ereboglobus luteus TaxID=1796921 RepID=A0A2U8E554_9BACT|nr:hypothetical protein [Ereboglobus luteus]AWI09981.1 hypothetical protein CKA38_12630 [Ereboglobus luteus]
MTQKAFAKREGVNIHTFVAWLAQYRRENDGGMSQSRRARTQARFVELSAPASCVMGATTLEVVLRDGRIVRGADAASLAGLARLLES